MNFTKSHLKRLIKEELQKVPFVGPAGRFLDSALRDAGLSMNDIYLTNVFDLRPKNNKIAEFCLSRKDLDKPPRQAPISANLLSGISCASIRRDSGVIIRNRKFSPERFEERR